MMTPADRSTVLGEVIRFHASRTPDAPAHWFNGVSTSYAQLDRYANQVANGLKEAGLERAARIGYLGKNSDVYFELLFGSARAGTVLVGLNWRLTAAELALILSDAGVKWLFVEEEFVPAAAQARLMGCAVVEKLTACSGAREAGYQAWRDGQSHADPGVEVHLDDVVVQMYTSGTTGKPKGVQITHRCFFAQMRAATQSGAWAQWRENDVSLLAMPVFHIGGTMWGFTALYQGGCNVILPVPQVAEITHAIERRRISRMFIVPTLLMMISDAAESWTADVSSVRVILYGASPIPEHVLERSMKLFNRASFVQQYGMTETAGAVCALAPEDHVRGARRMTSCGRAYPGVVVKIVSRDGEELAPGEVGEILIRTDAIMKGYWNQEEATAQVLRDGWYHSGDAGCLDEVGFLYIRDRIKDMIISGGENIYPAEIESVLHKHEGVQDVAVIGVSDSKWGEAVKAVVVARAGASPGEKELIEFARGHLAGYKLPKSIDFVQELPRNVSGKLLKHVLRKRYSSGE